MSDPRSDSGHTVQQLPEWLASVLDRATIDAIAKIRKSPYSLSWLRNGSARREIATLLAELAQRPGISYAVLGEVLGVSESYVGKLARGARTYFEYDKAARLCVAFNLPLDPILRAAALSELPVELVEAVMPDDEDEAVKAEDRRFWVNFEIPVEHFSWFSQDIDARVDFLCQYGQVRESYRPLPLPASENHLFVQQRFANMEINERAKYPLSSQRGGSVPLRVVPRGAIVEIEVLTVHDEVNSGDIVLAQFPGSKAGFFRIVTRGHLGQTELYFSLDRDEPVRVAEHAPQRGIHREEERALIGIARRIVDFDLQT